MSTVVLAGTGNNGQIYRSTDGGQTWSLAQKLESVSSVYSFADLGGGVVLAGTSGGHGCRSRKGGQSWWLVQQRSAGRNVRSDGDPGGACIFAVTGAD